MIANSVKYVLSTKCLMTSKNVACIEPGLPGIDYIQARHKDKDVNLIVDENKIYVKVIIDENNTFCCQLEY